MRTRLRAPVVAVVVTVAVAVLTSGCGSNSGPKAQPIPTAPTTAAPSRQAGATQSKSTADLSVVQRELDQAGQGLDQSNGDITAADPNSGRAQEGSAP
jgi:uncharacterized protein YceK